MPARARRSSSVPASPPCLRDEGTMLFWQQEDCRMPVSRPAEIRFHEKYRRDSGCWLWTAGSEAIGYGKFGVRRGLVVRAHRYMWESIHGPVPPGFQVCHSCDVRACVNPAHLFLGTPAENSGDMAKKGRSTRGQKNPMAKLTELQVRNIRRSHATGRDRRSLARQYGVRPECIDRIVSRRRWGHVP